jgi:hypothetical protein
MLGAPWKRPASSSSTRTRGPGRPPPQRSTEKSARKTALTALLPHKSNLVNGCANPQTLPTRRRRGDWDLFYKLCRPDAVGAIGICFIHEEIDLLALLQRKSKPQATRSRSAALVAPGRVRSDYVSTSGYGVVLRLGAVSEKQIYTLSN